MPIPPAIPEECTTQQLADVLAARLVGEVQRFAQVVRDIDASVKRMEEAGDGFTPFPRLSAEFDREVTAVVNAGATLTAEIRHVIATLHDLQARAVAVRTRYEEYAAEMNSVLGTVQRSPRG